MLADDRPAHPMQFFCRLWFAGAIDRHRFMGAASEAINRHRLLNATVARIGRCWCWVPSDKVEPELNWFATEPLDTMPAARWIDLESSPGLRITVRQGQSRADVVFHFHHACCDGTGAMQYIHDLLVLYSNANQHEARKVTLDALDEQKLLSRETFGLSRWDRLKLTRKQLVGVAGIRQFFSRSPQPLVPHEVEPDQSELPPAYPTVLVHEFDQQQTTSIKQRAMEIGVSMNDLLVGSLFLAITSWRSENRLGDERDWLRMSVPVSMRQFGSESIPAANFVSMIFLDRRGLDCEQPEELVRGIRDEMDLIKRNQLGFTFPLTLQAFKLLTGGVKRAINAKTCSASGLVTNVGTILARSPLPRHEGKLMINGLLLDRVEIGAPNRPYQCVAFSLLIYGGRLALCTQYDSRVLDKAQASGLLGAYVERLLGNL